MGAGSRKAAGSGTSLRSADLAYRPASKHATDTEGKSARVGVVGSMCNRSHESQNAQLHQGDHCINRHSMPQAHLSSSGQDVGSPRSTSSSRDFFQDIPEQLADVIVMLAETNGKELARAFLEAADYPPVTKESRGELDIQNILYNPRLRHDINYDRDLSFRPNLEGSRGQHKRQAAQEYWNALVAELLLYARYFQGTPPISTSPNAVQHIQRRIPKMFATLSEVLKSLVPVRDHARVDEQLDIAKLMQEIERGVCNLVGLAESIACLLKEHCAPMRDTWVDEMVVETKASAIEANPEGLAKKSVNGLSQLLGILEAMKLVSPSCQLRRGID